MENTTLQVSEIQVSSQKRINLLHTYVCLFGERSQRSLPQVSVQTSWQVPSQMFVHLPVQWN